jgi:hypothetical protein
MCEPNGIVLALHGQGEHALERRELAVHGRRRGLRGQALLDVGPNGRRRHPLRLAVVEGFDEPLRDAHR